jgi:hypothetical protein
MREMEIENNETNNKQKANCLYVVIGGGSKNKKDT